MGFDLDVTIPVFTVLFQGLLSFFSPCVLPIVPLYAGYLSGGAVGEGGYSRKIMARNTLCFILGVSFAFFSLGLGFSALGSLLTKHQLLFSRLGGILILFFGLMQLDVFRKPFHGGEWKLPIRFNALKMSPVTALLMGFTFSFAWTPCVGPALSTVLILVAAAQTSGYGLLLMGVYTLGFTLPFLLVGLFTTQCLQFFKAHRNVVSYTTKIGAVVMIIMGILMLTGTMNRLTSSLSTPEPAPAQDTIPAMDFTLKDQFDNTHTLSNYQGKTVFLNIWATWCPPCKQELPDIQKLYEAYGENQDDVIVLGVAFPNDENNYTQEGSQQHVMDFLDKNGYTYPTLMDLQGDMLTGYGISSFPTTFMIDANGNLFGYVPGMMTYDIMDSIVQQTMAGNVT